MVLAQGLTVESSTAKHTLGQRYMDPKTGAEYVYCVDSGSGNAQYKPCSIAPGTYATALLTKANADNGYDVGVPQIAVTASYYYWCMVNSGNLTTAYAHVASACASEAALYTTATSGRIDDSDSGQTLIAGIELTATAATAAASANAAAKIRNPKAMAAEVRIDAADAATDSVALVATSAASSAMSAQSMGTSAALLAVSAQSSGVVADSKAESAVVLANSAMSSAVSGQSSCVVADSKAESAVILANSAMSSAVSGQSSAVVADSKAESAVVLAGSAASSAMSAQSSASVAQSGVTMHQLAFSAYADSAVANSHSNAVSVAISADANYTGMFISTLVSGISSAVAKNF